MILGILHINKKVKTSSNCTQCRERIEVGQLHAVVILRYGAAQRRIVAARQATARRGRKQKVRAGLLYVRVHFACLEQWLPCRYEAIRESRAERKGGRPPGNTPLVGLSDDSLLYRRRLVRRRAALLRKILTEEAEDVLDKHYTSFIAIDEELSEGVPRVVSQVRRSGENTLILTSKLGAAKRRVECSQ